jgi:hypothetical protein
VKSAQEQLKLNAQHAAVRVPFGRNNARPATEPAKPNATDATAGAKYPANYATATAAADASAFKSGGNTGGIELRNSGPDRFVNWVAER